MQQSSDYDDMAAFVLNAKDANGDSIQISSSAFEIKFFKDERLAAGIPIVIINTPNSVPILSKEEYVKGTTVTLLNNDMSIGFQGEMKIKGRGNSTWNEPKKPYKIKFDSKQSLLGEPKDKEWVLLANCFDKSLIRNDLAFWMAATYGCFDYVPRYHFVNLILNGQYSGLYQLGEQVKISEDRVNVGKDGFLLEIDAKADTGDVTFDVPHIYKPVNIKDPDVSAGDENYNYVYDYVSRADAALYADDWLDELHGYKTLIDMQSFVEWYLVMEITKNNDAIFYSSCYMNLSRTGKLKMGPVWDFDFGFGGYPSDRDPGREFVNEPANFYIKGNTSWIDRMFEDPAFVSAVKTTFQRYYNNRSAIISHIDNTIAANKSAAMEDNRVWGTICATDCSEAEFESAYKEQADYLKQWLIVRFEWLKNEFDAM